MRYELVLTGKFKKGLKLAKKRGLNINLLDFVVENLLNGIPLILRGFFNYIRKILKGL